MKKHWTGCASSDFLRGRPADMKPEMIVLHTSNMSLAEDDVKFGRAGTSLSTHYAVGRQGEVHQYVEETDTAFHAGLIFNPTVRLVRERPHTNPSFYSIGIEHEGSVSETWASVQLATTALLRKIANRWLIHLDNDHVPMHNAIRSSANCPGSSIRIDDLVPMAVRETASTQLVGLQAIETKPKATDIKKRKER